MRREEWDKSDGTKCFFGVGNEHLERIMISYEYQGGKAVNIVKYDPPKPKSEFPELCT